MEKLSFASPEKKGKLAINLKTRDDNKCIICFDKQQESVLMKCGHGGFCQECAINMF